MALHPVTDRGPWVKLDEIIAVVVGDPTSLDAEPDTFVIFLQNGADFEVNFPMATDVARCLVQEIAEAEYREEHGESRRPKTL